MEAQVIWLVGQTNLLASMYLGNIMFDEPSNAELLFGDRLDAERLRVGTDR